MKHAIVLHLHYQDLWPEFWHYLKEIKDENIDVYVTVHTTETKWYTDIKANATDVFVIDNKGADFGGFLYSLHQIKSMNYFTITKLHGKKSPRMELDSNMPGAKEAGGGEKWRKALYLPLIGTPQKYKQNIELFTTNSNIYIVGPEQYVFITGKHTSKQLIKRNSRKPWIDRLLDIEPLPRKVHISGSMFIASKLYLDQFFKNKEFTIYNRAEIGFDLWSTTGHHLECAICNCDYFGGQLIGV